VNGSWELKFLKVKKTGCTYDLYPRRWDLISQLLDIGGIATDMDKCSSSQNGKIELKVHLTILVYVGDDEMLPKLKVRQQLAELDVSLKEQGAKFGPQIKELKALRTHLQDIELEHLEKNKHYNDISGVYERLAFLA
jgi:hypothetical protein